MMMEDSLLCQGKHLKKLALEFLCLCTVVLDSAAAHSPLAVVCPTNQTAEFGGQGYIRCNFPDNFSSVHWYTNPSENGHVVISYKASTEVKDGPGYESGDYDVDQDGSIIISNVTVWHERVYRVIVYVGVVFDTFLISLKVIALPDNQLPVITCQNCYDEYYYSLVEGKTLSCSFGAARPPVQLEWFQQSSDGYSHLEMQSFNHTENENGTYNSIKTLQPLNNDNLIHPLVCRATWSAADWRREKEILVDFSKNESFSDIPSETQYMEVNKHAKIQCGQPGSALFVIWKKIVPHSEPEMIGFHSHVMTETISNAPDVKVTTDGSLIFPSPQIQNEGVYICIHGDGKKEEIQITSVEILIPPSPPYIQITGCDDVSRRCLLNETTTKELECAVRGVRPTATLEWSVEDAGMVSFLNHKEIPKQKGETWDITKSVKYEVSPDVLCGESILIKCRLDGPLSKIMKDESVVEVIPELCQEREVKADVTSVDVGHIILGIMVVASVGVMIFFCIQSCHRNTEAANSGYRSAD